MRKFRLCACWFIFAFGFWLCVVNIYGLSQQIRPNGLEGGNLRFKDDIRYSFDEAIENIRRLDGESEEDFVNRLTFNISRSLAHIHWLEEPDPTRFNQLVPIWENYFLFFMGHFSGIPEYKKYHFANYERSLERGIGVCGDTSMITSQILDEQGIPNKIVNFPGHVVVEAFPGEDRAMILDADFGVVLPYSPGKLNSQPSLVDQHYLDQGYFYSDVKVLNRIYAGDFKRWNGTKHFITKKYYFEIMAYWLKWPFPVLMMVVSGWWFWRQKKQA